MPHPGDTVPRASQASDTYSHDAAAVTVLSSQASDATSDFTPPNRSRRASFANPREIYNSGSPIPSSNHPRKIRTRSSSIFSNNTIPGESQVLFIDITTLRPLGTKGKPRRPTPR
ncbi:hypothetical protein RSAG8_09769, partial [Rhizoctonia solani AG-8 WAC10335]